VQLGFYFDQTRCTGCYTCAVACKDFNDIPAGPAHWRRILSFEEGDYPDLFAAYLSTSCHHCADPICAAVCPCGAISKREDTGIVLVDQEKCRQAAPCGIISHCKDIPFGEMKSPCTLACPAGVNVQGYVGLIGKGRFKDALELIRQDLPIPSVCGRACTHPCESACSRRKLDESISIMELKRFVTDQESPMPDPLPITKRQNVAVVGSGPAGLSAAWGLIRRGYPVTIFEALPVAGGMLAVGLPEYRLPKPILQRDLDYLTALGVQIKTHSPVGDTLAVDELKGQGYEAVFIAVGAHKGHKSPIPGADLQGVLIGVSFLRDVNFKKRVNVGSKVMVLGGGRVALDCARAATRLGASEVHIACLENIDSMRAGPSEIRDAEEEGIVIHHAQTFVKIHGKGGRVSGIECLDVRSFSIDVSGQLQINAIPGTEHVFEADTVIFALGQSPELGPFPDFRISKTKTITVDPLTMATNLPGIFAGGEAVSGPMTIIEAVAAGKRAAAFMDSYLQGFIYKECPPTRDIESSEIEVRIPPDIPKQARRLAKALPKTRRRSWEEISMGFSEATAIEEAKRCLNCAGHLCLEVCPYHVPQFGSEQDSKMQKCNLCVARWGENKKPICVDACPTRAMDAGPLEELKAKYGDTKEAEGFAYCGSISPSICFKPKKYQVSHMTKRGGHRNEE
jgi:NADPH-dependent glutamate synthase beta subunit-like oxidoreductase